MERLEDRTLLSGWAIGLGGAGHEMGRAIAVDSAGDVYVTGNFGENSATADFDPGPGTYSLTSAGGTDIFVAKYASTGALVWARRAGGTGTDAGRGIALDGAGNVYVTGSFSGTADFGPFTVSTAANLEIFVAKLDSAGNFVWVREPESPPTGTPGLSRGDAIAVSGDSVVASGVFNYSIDADPGPGTSTITSASAPLADILLWKLDTSGNFGWAQRAGGTTYDSSWSVAADGSGVYLTGEFTGTADFGATVLTGSGSGSSTGDVFVSKLDLLGNFLWTQGIGGLDGDKGRGIALDAQSNVHVTGQFVGAVDFDAGPGTTTLGAAGMTSTFVLKLDSSGSFVWAKEFRPAGSAAWSHGDAITTDAIGNVYVTGDTGGTIDFDPGAGTAYMSADRYVSKLNSAGDFAFVRGIAIAAAWENAGIAVDGSGNIYTAGSFGNTVVGTADFDIGATVTTLTTTGGLDAFVARTDQTVPASPQLARLTDSPDPAPKNSPLTLTARNLRVVSGGSNVASVSFYRDKNGNGTLEVGTDTLLGTDTDGSNGWSLTTTASNKNGIYTYFAQAKDSSNVAGNVVSARNRVGPGGPVAAVVASRDRSAASVDAAIASHFSGNDDREVRLGLLGNVYRHTLRSLLRARRVG